MATANGGELSTKQRTALDAMAAGLDVTTAAKLAGVARQTLHKWMRLPAFAAELTAREAEVIHHSGRRLLTLQNKAIDVIEAVLDSSAHPAIRLQAARLVIDAALRLREVKNLEERLAQLEAAIRVQ